MQKRWIAQNDILRLQFRTEKKQTGKQAKRVREN